MSRPLPPLWVLIVAYGDPEHLRRALEALRGAFPTVVVDNSSSPTTAGLARLLGARYLDPGRNLGFAAGVNYGLAEVPAGSDVLLINPDALVTPATARGLQEVLASDPRAACAAPLLLHPDTGETERPGWPFPSPGQAWLNAFGLGRLANRCDFVTGAVLALSGRALADVGAFDERFFVYAEEVDWQRRAARRGWKRLLAAGLTAEHVGGATATNEEWRDTLFHASYERYLRKWYGSAGWQLARVAGIATHGLRLALRRGEGRGAARRRLSLFLAGPVRRASVLSPPGDR